MVLGIIGFAVLERRVRGLGFGFLECRVRGLGFGVWGLESCVYKVWGLEFKVWCSRVHFSSVRGLGFRV